MESDQELRSLKRGLEVLALLNQIETVSISELARRINLPRTTAERILLTLAAEGYVERPPSEKRYRLSAKVCSLSEGFSDDSWITHIATSLLFDVTRKIGWPLAIATPAGEYMVLRLTTDTATSLWLNRRRIGARTPMLGSSSGLVSFAFSQPAEQEQLITLFKQSSNALNRERSSNDLVLRSFIDPVLHHGYAFQPPPNDAPERSISVPIMINESISAVLLMIYMPRALKNAVVVRDYLPLLKNLANTISERVQAHDHARNYAGDDQDMELPDSVTRFRPRYAS
jgi:IclR family mhp operon transcriptional activator